MSWLVYASCVLQQVQRMKAALCMWNYSHGADTDVYLCKGLQ